MSLLQATATIQDLSTDGRGVVRIENVVYFVPRGMPGDELLLELLPQSKPPSANIVSIITPSPLRRPHPCPHADTCQGSVWGCLDDSAQLSHKRDLVERTLRKAAGGITVLPTVAGPLPWKYRNRISLNVWRRGDALEVGFRTESRQESGIPIRTCYLPVEAVSECLPALTRSLAGLPSPLVPLPRRIQIHQTAAGAGLLVMIPGTVTPDITRFWSQQLAPCAPGGLWFAESSLAGIVRYDKPITHTEQALPMQTEWLGQTVDVHPAAFCQANAAAANRVGERLQQFSREQHYERVWDLYGGFGALGMAAAGPERPLYVLELSRLSEKTMQQLAGQQGISRVQFIPGDLLRTFPSRVSGIREQDLIVLDPPRSGAHPEILAQINRSKARRLAYLSCNPARLGRDLTLLAQGGFVPVEIQPYDFFPQTPATEVLTLLSRS
ncbi:MAG TPA: hypothetical protein VGL38_15085 [bacterium]|jgi:23S rRNA (uracil1939-C5)-methyltransferase